MRLSFEANFHTIYYLLSASLRIIIQKAKWVRNRIQYTIKTCNLGTFEWKFFRNISVFCSIIFLSLFFKIVSKSKTVQNRMSWCLSITERSLYWEKSDSWAIFLSANYKTVFSNCNFYKEAHVLRSNQLHFIWLKSTD